MIVTGITKRVELPHEPGEWIEIRQLGHVALRKAREAKLDRLFSMAKAAGKDVLAALPQSRPNSQTDQVGAEDNLLSSYDEDMLLRLSIVAWSYPESVTKENLDALDQVTVKVVLDAIIGDFLPATQVEQKNS